MQLKIAFSAITLIMTASCEGSGDDARGVAPDAYLDFPSCWTGDGEHFSAFLILEQNSGGFRPHFISSRCYVAAGGRDTTLNHLNDLMVAGDKSDLKARAGMTGDFQPNTVTDVALPADRARVYLFEGALALHAMKEYPDALVYDVARVDRLTDSGMSFAQFRGLSSNERTALFRTLIHVR